MEQREVLDRALDAVDGNHQVVEACGLDPSLVPALPADGSIDPDVAEIAAVWPSLPDGIRHAIRILSGQGPVTAPGHKGVSRANGRLKRSSHGQNGQLPNWSHPLPALMLAAR